MIRSIMLLFFLTTVLKRAETNIVDEIKQASTAYSKEEILKESTVYCTDAVAASINDIHFP